MEGDEVIVPAFGSAATARLEDTQQLSPQTAYHEFIKWL